MRAARRGSTGRAHGSCVRCDIAAARGCNQGPFHFESGSRRLILGAPPSPGFRFPAASCRCRSGLNRLTRADAVRGSAICLYSTGNQSRNAPGSHCAQSCPGWRCLVIDGGHPMLGIWNPMPGPRHQRSLAFTKCRVTEESGDRPALDRVVPPARHRPGLHATWARAACLLQQGLWPINAVMPEKPWCRDAAPCGSGRRGSE